jgi:hypothetical protein
MTAHVVREKDVVFDLYVARERRAVGKDIVITYRAVVRNVHAYHKEVARAHARSFPFAARAVYGHKLAYQIIVAYDKLAHLSLELYILRETSQHGVLSYTIASPQSRVAFNDGMSADFAAGAYAHVSLYDDIRADAYVLAKLRARADKGCWMNVHDYKRGSVG